ncbi:MAG: hypothetical protein US30_C0008G0040 [Candidatus Moranbacteria bacterium GW2011_GWF2_36_839]|nr:MAG: hypothetical protein US27_C0008G0040 [Candidatus Moranbacteria bacterium GW2011_GWF1_36_78]KKQ17022.1 MAG: hypothetical protein US30_C0008G0040 [Candidatus Moranbacteria bacterium GW2011_GWF2_36_839]HAT74033.1 hypothetical protein [Candidatus Moranbacteria bacterium]HBY11197.1 hypothetical protein [Candidatus Moranbacteria bacterium]
MDEELEKKLSDSLLYKLYKLEEKENGRTFSDEDKIKKIEKIKKEYEEQIAELEKERDAVIGEAVALLEKKKIEEIRKEL